MLVAYFSATRTTAYVARKVAEAANARLLEIEPVQPYTPQDLDWTDEQSRSSLEMQNPASRPEMKPVQVDLADREAMVIGFPNWWGTAPHIIHTFLESQDFTGHPIFLFETSGGSGITKAIEDLKKAYPHLDIRHGKRLIAQEAKNISTWARSL